MIHIVSFTFQTPRLLLLAGGVALITFLIAIVRKPDVPMASSLLAGLGLVLLSLAAGAPLWFRPAAQDVAVMVDLSPSTRGAAYRDRDALRRRIGDLLGDTPYRLIFFADTNRAGSLDSPLEEIPADH